MLSGITWTDYFIGMGILITAYYAYVMIRYYPEELKSILRSGQKQRSEQMTVSDMFIQTAEGYSDDSEYATNEYDIMENAEEDNEFMQVEELVTSITNTVEKASKNGMVKGEFKQMLRMVLREKPTVKDSPFRQSINDLIVSECSKYGTYTLSAKEVDVLWEI